MVEKGWRASQWSHAKQKMGQLLRPLGNQLRWSGCSFFCFPEGSLKTRKMGSAQIVNPIFSVIFKLGMLWVAILRIGVLGVVRCARRFLQVHVILNTGSSGPVSKPRLCTSTVHAYEAKNISSVVSRLLMVVICGEVIWETVFFKIHSGAVWEQGCSMISLGSGLQFYSGSPWR